MTPANWISLLSAGFAGIAVLLPFLFKRIEKRDRLARTTYLVELLKAREELEQLLERGNRNTGISKEAIETLEEIDKELTEPVEVNRYGLFIVMAFVESVLFVSTAFAEISEWYSRLFKGKSYESGYYFLEGIFGNPVARIFLLVFCIVVAIIGTLKIAPILAKRVKSYYGFNFALLGIFNAEIIIVTVATGLFLTIFDPLVSLW